MLGIRPDFNGLHHPEQTGDIYGYYRQVRADIEHNISKSKKVAGDGLKKPILNETQTNSKADEKGSVFDIFGD